MKIEAASLDYGGVAVKAVRTEENPLPAFPKLDAIAELFSCHPSSVRGCRSEKLQCDITRAEPPDIYPYPPASRSFEIALLVRYQSLEDLLRWRVGTCSTRRQWRAPLVDAAQQVTAFLCPRPQLIRPQPPWSMSLRH
jgi:hypothetical protein